MSKRLTPIERAIAGEPTDRRKRYDEKMRRGGFTRVTAMLRADDAELMRQVAKKLRDDPDAINALRSLLERLEAPHSGPERPQRSEDAPRRSAPRTPPAP